VIVCISSAGGDSRSAVASGRPDQGTTTAGIALPSQGTCIYIDSKLFHIVN